VKRDERRGKRGEGERKMASLPVGG